VRRKATQAAGSSIWPDGMAAARSTLSFSVPPPGASPEAVRLRVSNARHVSRFQSGKPALAASHRLHCIKASLATKIGLLQLRRTRPPDPRRNLTYHIPIAGEPPAAEPRIVEAIVRGTECSI
jgi:hypothetical protein